jgi:hypothetical protein
MFSKYLFLFLFSINYFFVFAQDTIVSSSVYNRNHFTTSLQIGGNKTHSTQQVGNLKPTSLIGTIYQGDFKYTMNISDKWGLSGGIGGGVFSYGYDIKEFGIGRLPYFDDLSYTPFFTSKMEVIYRIPISKKLTGNIFSGFGTMNFIEHTLRRSLTSNNVKIFHANESFSGDVIPIFIGGFGVSKQLANNQLLSFSLEYVHGFKNVFEGDFFVTSPEFPYSSGTIYNKGNRVNLSIGYSFTQKEKLEKDLVLLNSHNDKDAKKEYFKEKRAIKQNSTLVSISGGPSFQVSKSQINNQPEESITDVNYMVYGYLEQILKNNYFAEVGFGFQDYYRFNAFQTNFGVGKRFVNPKNGVNYINAHIGVVANLTDVQKNTFTHGFMNSDSTEEYTTIKTGIRKANALVYLGLSKDFRLSKGFYFSILYRYYQGIGSLYRLDQQIYRTEPFSQTRFFNGTAHTLQFGFKFDLGDLNEKRIKKDLKSHEKGDVILTLDNTLNFLYHYRFRNDSIQFKQSWLAYLPQLGVEYYLNPKTYIQARIGYQVYHTFKMRMDYSVLNLGLSRQLNFPNGLNLVNIEGGLSAYFVAYTKGYEGETTFFDSYDSTDVHGYHIYSSSSLSGNSETFYFQNNDTIANSHNSYGVNRRLIPGIYIGVSKDFRLSNQFTLSLAYRRQFGFHYFYTEESNSKNINSNYFMESNTYKEKINGNASQIVISLKYKLK